MRNRLFLLACFAMLVCVSIQTAWAAPIITGLVENNADPARPAAIVTSASNPSPSGTSSALVDEAFAMVNRTHEYTAVRTDPTTNLLTTTQATGILQPFPSYLVGLEYIQISNENRTRNPYSLDVTLSQAATAYLFLDNRLDGVAGNNSKTNTTDPVLGGPLQWVIDDGWQRVNTGFMPNGQADYLGIDEGASVAGEGLRVHTSSGLVAGSGNGLNNFFAIYSKQFSAGSHVGFTKTQGITGNVYGVAVAPIPEPSTLVMLAVAAALAFGILRRR